MLFASPPGLVFSGLVSSLKARLACWVVGFRVLRKEGVHPRLQFTLGSWLVSGLRPGWVFPRGFVLVTPGVGFSSSPPQGWGGLTFRARSVKVRALGPCRTSSRGFVRSSCSPRVRSPSLPRVRGAYVPFEVGRFPGRGYHVGLEPRGTFGDSCPPLIT